MRSEREQGKKMWIISRVISSQRWTSHWGSKLEDRHEKENVIWWWSNIQQNWVPLLQCLTPNSCWCDPRPLWQSQFFSLWEEVQRSLRDLVLTNLTDHTMCDSCVANEKTVQRQISSFSCVFLSSCTSPQSSIILSNKHCLPASQVVLRAEPAAPSKAVLLRQDESWGPHSRLLMWILIGKNRMNVVQLENIGM